MSNDQVKKAAQAVVSETVKAKWLDGLKRRQSLGAVLAECMETAVADTLAEHETDNEKSVVKLVAAQLQFLAEEAGYDEDYVSRVISECKGALGYVSNKPGQGRKPQEIPHRAYMAITSMADSEAGRGTNAGAKFWRGVAKLALQLAKEEISLADVRAHKAPEPVKTDAEKAGKVVPMPAAKPTAKAA